MMTISTKRRIIEPGLCSTMKEGPFLEREYVKNFLLFVICSGLFFFLLLSIFLQNERKQAQADFYGAIHTPPNFFFFKMLVYSKI